MTVTLLQEFVSPPPKMERKMATSYQINRFLSLKKNTQKLSTVRQNESQRCTPTIYSEVRRRQNHSCIIPPTAIWSNCVSTPNSPPSSAYPSTTQSQEPQFSIIMATNNNSSHAITTSLPVTAFLFI